jgi:hypothetical protein
MTQQVVTPEGHKEQGAHQIGYKLILCYILIVLLAVLSGILFRVVVLNAQKNQLGTLSNFLTLFTRNNYIRIYDASFYNDLFSRLSVSKDTMYQSFHVSELVTSSALINTVLSTGFTIILSYREKRFFGISAIEYPQYKAADTIARHMRVLSLFLISLTLLTYALGWESIAVGFGMGSFINAGIMVWYATRDLKISIDIARNIHKQCLNNDHKWRNLMMEMMRKDILNNQGTELKIDHDLETYFECIDLAYDALKAVAATVPPAELVDLKKALRPLQTSLETMVSESYKYRSTMCQIISYYKKHFHHAEIEAIQIYIMDYCILNYLCETHLSGNDTDVQIVDEVICQHEEIQKQSWKLIYWEMVSKIRMVLDNRKKFDKSNLENEVLNNCYKLKLPIPTTTPRENK